AGFSGCTPHCVALVRCTCECVSRATDISGRSLDLTAQATRRLRLSDPLPTGRRVAPWRPGGAGFSGRTGGSRAGSRCVSILVLVDDGRRPVDSVTDDVVEVYGFNPCSCG